ncbi:hypothetical protein CCMSSC00406_0008138 [Pleurotus cornucopiae]|uniref:Uncharacterized protein n=1 Tax=Pleurotus cornucopiae TaxID=5321 RepID=A0ACB7IPH8_PLECO|nr:hypothetical protein CCMSSC00406_0008138 [Pleurotus cornucopiae]
MGPEAAHPELPPEVWRRILEFYQLRNGNKFKSICQVNRLFYDFAMVYKGRRFETLDLRLPVGRGTTNLLRARWVSCSTIVAENHNSWPSGLCLFFSNPWLAERLKSIYFSTSTLVELMAGGLTFLLPLSLRPPPTFPLPLLGSYDVEAALAHPLIQCISEVLPNVKNLHEYVVTVEYSPMYASKHSELERRLLRILLAQLPIGGLASTPRLQLHVDSCKFPLLLDELLVADLSTLKVLYITASHSFTRLRGAIDSTKLQALFQRLAPLESLHISSGDYAVAAHINSIFDNDIILPKLRRLEITMTFDNIWSIRAICSNYPMMTVLELNLIVSGPRRDPLPLSALDLPNLHVFTLSMKWHMNPTTFWHGQFNSPHLRTLRLVKCLKEPQRRDLRYTTTKICGFFKSESITHLETDVSVLEKYVLDIFAASFPKLRTLAIRAEGRQGIVRFEEEMRGHTFPGWNIHEATLSVAGKVDQQLVALLRKCLDQPVLAPDT